MHNFIVKTNYAQEHCSNICEFENLQYTTTFIDVLNLINMLEALCHDLWMKLGRNCNQQSENQIKSNYKEAYKSCSVSNPNC